MQTQYSLLQINKHISESIKQSFPAPVWVQAEIAKISYSAAGHTYLELIEKNNSTTVAVCKGNIWASYSICMHNYVEKVGQPLQVGSKILFLARVDFHERYGLSLTILDLDTSYALGELLKQKQEILKQLTEEGHISRNKQLPFPSCPQRIAVISSPTAAGLADFQQRMLSNQLGVQFTLQLFPSEMQGDNTPSSLCRALQNIRKEADNFDCVAILRGGGAATDLHCFDAYEPAREIAMFPLPVITGIGHHTDLTILDLVAYHSADTPTALAEYLMQHTAQFIAQLDQCSMFIMNYSDRYINSHHTNLQQLADNLSHYVAIKLQAENDLLARSLNKAFLAVLEVSRIQREAIAITETSLIRLAQQHNRIEHNKINLLAAQLQANTKRGLLQSEAHISTLEKIAMLHDPQTLLKKGFSITRIHGRAITSVSRLQPGELLETRLEEGIVFSSVEKIQHA